MNTYQQIVLLCLQDALSNEARSKLTTLPENEWQSVLQAADALAVTPLLPRCIQKLNIPLPPNIQTSLQTSLKNNTARNLRLLADFQALAKALNRSGIPIMPLKGIYLCTSLYDNIGERVLGDIDILFQKTDLERAITAIEVLGYRPSRPYDMETEQKHLHHMPAYVKNRAAPLEIHWTLLSPRFGHYLDPGDIWERSIPAKLNGMDIQALSPNDLIVYLCAHAAYQHMYAGALRSLYDIKLAVGRYSNQLDWNAIRQQANNWELLNCVYLTLHLVDDLLISPLPESIWQSLRPADFKETLLQAARTRIFEYHEVSPVLTTTWTSRTLLQRFKGSWNRIALQPSVLAGLYKLPPKSKMVYLYYFVRARDLVKVHGRDVLDLLVGRKGKKEFALGDNELIGYLHWWDPEKQEEPR